MHWLIASSVFLGVLVRRIDSVGCAFEIQFEEPISADASTSISSGPTNTMGSFFSDVSTGGVGNMSTTGAVQGETVADMMCDSQTEFKCQSALGCIPIQSGWSKVPVALPVLIPVPVLFSASAASAAKFHTEKALVLA